MAAAVNLLGQKFERLTVIARATNSSDGRARWHCKCDCGNETTVYGKYLVAGRSKSCGCFRKDYNIANPHPTHGHSSGGKMSPTYNSWRCMIQRTTNPKYIEYENYGGRGITVCESWKKFENFLADMGERPSKDHSIDRINSDGPYELQNCRWATRSEQNTNRRPYKLKKPRRNKEIRIDHTSFGPSSKTYFIEEGPDDWKNFIEGNFNKLADDIIARK